MAQMGTSIPRRTRKERRESGEGKTLYQPSVSPSPSTHVDGYLHFQETKTTQGGNGARWEEDMSCYRCQLEKEIQALEKQLQEENDVHAALIQAVGNNYSPLPISQSKLPVQAQELLTSIVVMENIVAKLEEEVSTLNFQLQHKQREHHATVSHVKHLPVSPLKSSSSTSGYMSEKVPTLSVSKLHGQLPLSLHLDVLQGSEKSESFTETAETRPSNEVLRQSSGGAKKKLGSLQPYLGEFEAPKMNLWQRPNELSEEMALCMKNILLCLSGSSSNTSKLSLSECMYYPTSTGHLSLSSWLPSSDSFRFPSSMHGSLDELHDFELMGHGNLYDPYGVNERLKWTDIGKYSFASEVSWMFVGKVQLKYASEALKMFRFLVDQLAEVNPENLSGDERLAFWINIYNALMMHAYLAYGAPKSEIKLFSLMKEASYTIRGQSFSAIDIEFIILKMKPPAHCPQIALVLTLYKFKMSEEHKKYSIVGSEPLVLFALSCGMHSCPAVQIFTAKSVRAELQNAMTDYIRASIGINRDGKLLVPKLLYYFAKEFVEESCLIDWISQHLTKQQAAIVQGSEWHKNKRLNGSQSFAVLPFNSRFRYLFLPSSQKLPA